MSYYSKNRNKVLEYQKEYYKKNRLHIKEYNAQYFKNHKEELLNKMERRRNKIKESMPPKKYICEPCKYETNRKIHYDSHLKTRIHYNNTHDDKIACSSPSETLYSCKHCHKFNMYYSQYKIHCGQIRHKSKVAENKAKIKDNEVDEIKIQFN